MPKDTSFKTVAKNCAVCGTSLTLTQNIHIERKQYCSVKCRQIGHRGQGHGANHFREARQCQKCGIDYIARGKHSKFCSRKCGSQVAAQRHIARYNCLETHLKRLLRMTGYDRTQLSLGFLLSLHAQQDGRCALTGLQMTWETGSGHVPTNLSIDRISCLEGYTERNVQLVCRVANVMKGQMSQQEFIEMCRRIVEKNGAL